MSSGRIATFLSVLVHNKAINVTAGQPHCRKPRKSKRAGAALARYIFGAVRSGPESMRPSHAVHRLTCRRVFSYRQPKAPALLCLLIILPSAFCRTCLLSHCQYVRRCSGKRGWVWY